MSARARQRRRRATAGQLLLFLAVWLLALCPVPAPTLTAAAGLEFACAGHGCGCDAVGRCLDDCRCFPAAPAPEVDGSSCCAASRAVSGPREAAPSERDGALVEALKCGGGAPGGELLPGSGPLLFPVPASRSVPTPAPAFVVARAEDRPSSRAPVPAVPPPRAALA